MRISYHILLWIFSNNALIFNRAGIIIVKLDFDLQKHHLNLKSKPTNLISIIAVMGDTSFDRQVIFVILVFLKESKMLVTEYRYLGHHIWILCLDMRYQ